MSSEGVKLDVDSEVKEFAAAGEVGAQDDVNGSATSQMHSVTESNDFETEQEHAAVSDQEQQSYEGPINENIDTVVGGQIFDSESDSSYGAIAEGGLGLQAATESTKVTKSLEGLGDDPAEPSHSEEPDPEIEQDGKVKSEEESLPSESVEANEPTVTEPELAFNEEGNQAEDPHGGEGVAGAEPLGDSTSAGQPEAILGDVESSQASELFGDAFSSWTKKKPYLGGYRDKRNGKLFFNSEAQTTTPHEIRDANRTAERFHRDTQTVYVRNRTVQSVRSTHTQMTARGRTYIFASGDQTIDAKRYVTSDEWEANIIKNVVRIQCWVRCVYAKRLLRKYKAMRDERLKKIAEREKKRQEMEDKRRQKELEAQLHPKTKRDFERLYHGLEVWRLQETEKINQLNLQPEKRLESLAELLNKEASLIQQIDHLKTDVSVEMRERKIQSFLERVSSPKKWPVHNAKTLYTLVDTPSIIRARELRDLYTALVSTHATINNRLQVLLHVKYTVKEFDCPLTRNIVSLIDREGDLLKRGRDTKALEGLRLRISNLFFQFMKTPEFNPEAASLQKFPNEGHSWNKNQPVYYCRGCTQYLPCTAFYLSTTMKQLGRCKACVMQENIATARRNELVYTNMLNACRLQEEKKRLNAMDDSYDYDTQKVINLLQESDLEYILSVMWHNCSAISGSKNMENLVLTRWDASQELSPWNCILLTNKEAITHDSQKNAVILYGKEFCEKVQQKLLLAKQHFKQLPSIAQYLHDNYTETPQGILVPIGKPKPLQSSILPSANTLNHNNVSVLKPVDLNETPQPSYLKNATKATVPQATA